MYEIKAPIKRGKLRRYFGKEYYILKRKKDWYTKRISWASKQPILIDSHLVFHHKSLILRPLKDVDMYLQENKRTNLAIALEHLNGICIKPKEVFSIWKNVGRPTQAKGYLKGLILNQGKIDTDIGGGLCQMGNLLFWIFAHSPLDIIERHRHGFDVFPDVNRKVPFGAGATLAYNHIDLQVKNNTSEDYQLELWMDNTHLNGRLTCSKELSGTYRVEEVNHIIKQQYWGGYSRHNQIIQKVIEDDIESSRLLVENHAIMMYNPFLES